MSVLVTVVTAAEESLADRWRDTGPVLWVVAGFAALAWLALLALLAARSEPRAVAPAPPTFELAGPEPPAVVSLVAGDWELDRQAVPATLLDLAARGFVSVEWLPPHTFVRVREHGSEKGGLTDYERLVLDHVRGLSAQTTDGLVPADALTTGPDAAAQRWWRSFRAGVVDDARQRGLSRPRWAPGARAALGALAVVVGLTVGIAATTLSKEDTDDDPLGTAIALAVVSASTLICVAAVLRGERDTPAGRAAAARWLGLRTMLADDPVFATQPPAAVAIWDRLLAYGAAMGEAELAVETLPLGAEREREAWSPVGNRWRRVRIRYPDVIPPGYGRSPALVALTGLAVTAFGILTAPTAIAIADAVLDFLGDLATADAVPDAVRVVVGVALGAVLAFAALVACIGLVMLVTGLVDLVRPRRTVQGRVLRIRERNDDDPYWHLAVDDGTTDRVRAWRMGEAPPAAQGDTVRARVSRVLHHVSELTVVTAADSGVPAAPSTDLVPDASDETPLPPLPDAATVSAAVGQPVHLATDASAYPLALAGASQTFVTDDGGRVIAAWVPVAEVDRLRDTARRVDVGDEAYRAPRGDGVIARVGGRALMVLSALTAPPGASGDDEPGVAATVARAVTASVSGIGREAPPPPAPG